MPFMSDTAASKSLASSGTAGAACRGRAGGSPAAVGVEIGGGDQLDSVVLEQVWAAATRSRRPEPAFHSGFRVPRKRALKLAGQAPHSTRGRSRMMGEFEGRGLAAPVGPAGGAGGQGRTESPEVKYPSDRFNEWRRVAGSGQVVSLGRGDAELATGASRPSRRGSRAARGWPVGGGLLAGTPGQGIRSGAR
jgi:hypothetical protein